MRAPTPAEQSPHTWRRVLRTVVRVVRGAVFLALVPLLVYLWPASLGGQATIVFVSGDSMLPTISTDDVVVARTADSYAVGDVVVVEIPQGQAAAGERIIHRLVGGSSSTGWFTKGDNRDYPDQWMLTDADIVGKAEVIAPLGDEARFAIRLILWPVVWASVGAVSVFRFAWRRLGASRAAGESDGAGESSGSGESDGASAAPPGDSAPGSPFGGDASGASDADSTLDGGRTRGGRHLVGRRLGRRR